MNAWMRAIWMFEIPITHGRPVMVKVPEYLAEADKPLAIRLKYTKGDSTTYPSHVQIWAWVHDANELVDARFMTLGDKTKYTFSDDMGVRLRRHFGTVFDGKGNAIHLLSLMGSPAIRIGKAEKAERDNKFGPNEGKVDPNDPFFGMAGIGRAKDNYSSGNDHDNVLYGEGSPYAYDQILQWTMELMKADCECEDTTEILLKMKNYVDNRRDSRKIVRGSAMSGLKCPKCGMPLIKLRGTKEFCLEKCEKCDLAVTYPRE